MRRSGYRGFNPGGSRGAALFISLALLLVLTIIGVSSVQTTTLETRMARNEQDALLAFQAAESALRDAEDFMDVVVGTDMFTSGGAGGLWTVAELGTPQRWEVAAAWAGDGSVAAPEAIAGAYSQPRYMIEHVASVLREENAYQISSDYSASEADRVEVFRITALGVGGSANARVLLQTTFGKILE